MNDKEIEQSEMIQKALGHVDNKTALDELIVMMYIPDMSFSRAAICHAHKILEQKLT